MNTSGRASPQVSPSRESGMRSSRLMNESFRSSRGFGNSMGSSRLGASSRIGESGKGKTFAFPDQEDEEAFRESVEVLKAARGKKAWVLKTLGEAVRGKTGRITQG
jgi:hypothetical protein